MFVGDPVVAFTNLHRALRPDGWLTLLTWQSVAGNEWLTEIRPARAVGGDLSTPAAPGPFTFADPDRVRTILEAAGFADVSFQGLHAPMSFGHDFDDAFAFVSGLHRHGLDQAHRDAALAALRATIAGHAGITASLPVRDLGSSRCTSPDGRTHPTRRGAGYHRDVQKHRVRITYCVP